MGAAAHGAVIGGSPSHSILVDITPYTFGTSAIDFDENGPTYNRYVPIVKRNTPLPVSKTEAFATASDDQEMVEVNIYQGEAPSATDNTFIGKFLVKGLSKVPSGNLILLNLELNLNGILKVTATEKATGLTKTVVMDTTKAGVKSTNTESADPWDDFNDEVNKPEEPETKSTENEALTQAKNLRKRAEKLLSAGINEEDARELKELLEKSREAITSRETGILADFNTSLEDLIFYLED
jgi:molecular chaperone DnaK